MQFLLQRKDGNDWSYYLKTSLFNVLKPNSIPSTEIEIVDANDGTTDDHRIQISNGIISFTLVNSGIQMDFKNYTGTHEEARTIANEVIQNITSATNTEMEIVE